VAAGQRRLKTVPLYTESPRDAALDVAVSHALMRSAADAGQETLRVWTPPPAVSFGRLDLLSPRHELAIAAARAAGLTPVRRLAGGRAAAVGPGTVCFGWASPSGGMIDMQQRYELMAELLVGALAHIGAEARVGELESEWCPGAWSVLVDDTKVGGLAQRVVRGGAWAEAVLIVSGSEPLVLALDQVQHALDVAWSPGTMAGLSDTDSETSAARVTEALLWTLRSRWDWEPMLLSPELWLEAQSLREEHVL